MCTKYYNKMQQNLIKIECKLYLTRGLIMNMVNPIKDKNDIDKIKIYLQKENIRNYLLFIIGINTAIKSNLILKLKLKDIVDEQHNIRENIEVEGRRYYINESIREAIINFIDIKNIGLDDYLFESQKSNMPINRSHLYKILKSTVKYCNIDINVGNETLRKTFGYHYYYQTGDVKYLKTMFNKSSKKKLFEYLDIEKPIINNSKFYL